MEIKNFIEQLQQSHIHLVQEKDNLILRADKSKLSEKEINKIKQDQQIIDFIRNNKEKIIAYLSTIEEKQTVKRQEHIAAIYPLSSLQEGMLVQSLYDDTAYTQQLSCQLTHVDITAFKSSWSLLLRKHSILRTGFHHDAFKQPVQSVYKQVTLPLEELDLRALTVAEQQEAIRVYEEQDRRKGFVLKDAPLMRIALLRLSEERYYMLWSTHHLILDGWSTPVLIGEFLETYQQLLAGQEPVVGEDDNYEDYIRYIAAQDKDREQAYWRQYLSGLAGGTLLPFVEETANRTKGVEAFQVERLRLDEQLSGSLQQYAQEQQITLSTLMQGVWSLLLHAYTGNSDVVYGVVHAGRPQELRNISQRVGMYVNTLPFRAQIPAEKPISTWLRELQQQQSGTLQYQYSSLNHIREQLALSGDLFDTILSFQNFPVSDVIATHSEGIDITEVNTYEQSTNYPLCIRVSAAKDINIEFIYRGSLLHATVVERIKSHFAHVLAQVVGDAALLAADLRIITAAEQEWIDAFNSTGNIYPSDTNIVSLFREQVLQTPGNIALEYEQQLLTYTLLDQRSNQVSHYLRSLGVRPGELVAVKMPRSADLIIGILGILKAGAGYVPVDPGYPADRISYMLSDSGVDIVLTAEEIDASSSFSSTDLQVVVAHDDIAYLMYTSGSTGRPKGVVVEHRNVVSLVKGVDYVSLSSDEVLLSTGSPSFDATTLEYWGMLLNGGRLVMCAEEQLLDASKLKTLITGAGVTMMWFTAGWLHQLIDIDINVFSGLRTILAGGDRLSPAHLRRLRDHYPAIRLINGYGPTENTTFSLTYEINAVPEGTDIPIGRPLSNRTAYILDEQGRICPLGAEGELCVGGAGLSWGYYGQEELTAQKFRDHGSLGRLYHTGDRCRWREDGTIAFLGRRDDQLKLRGYRIELGEIEHVLSGAPGVEQGVVCVVSDAKGGKRLLAYVTGDVIIEDVQAYLSARLPVYMVPSGIVALETFPLTGNGKVNRQQLIALQTEKEKVFTAPRNSIEEALCKIWSEVLEAEQVDIHDNFFELGGHSLLAIRVIAAVRKQLQQELSIRDLFSYPTVAGLSEVLKGVSTESAGASGIMAATRPASIPLSFSQERLWFIDKLQGSVQYHMPWQFEVRGALDVDRLEAAFRRIVERHEVLRTVIREQEGIGYQEVMPATGWKMTCIRELPAGVDAGTYLQQLATRPYELSSDYMLRVTVIAIAADAYLLQIMLHHIAFDGWSISILVKELVALYGDISAELPALPVQYADYAIWQREHLSGDLLTEKLSYWRKQLADVETLSLPTDHVRPKVQSLQGATVTRVLDKSVAESLKQFSQSEGVTLFMTLLAAFKVLLSRYSGQGDICIGTPVAGRRNQEVEGLIGFFVNTLALRSQVSGTQSFRSFLQAVKQTVLSGYEHQDIPFEKVVETLEIDRDLSRTPVFQVMFALQNMPDSGALDLPALYVASVHNPEIAALFDLGLDIVESDSGLHLVAVYCSDLFEESTIQRLLDHYIILLKAITKEKETAIGRLPLISSREQEELIRVFGSASDITTGNSLSFIQLLEQQLQRSSGEIALIHKDHHLSYAILNELSGKTAAYLKQVFNIKKGDRVMLRLDRSEQLLIALIAVWRCGAVYVPVATNLPDERVRFIAEDVEPALVITHDTLNMDIIRNYPVEVSVYNTPAEEAYIMYTSGSTGTPKGVVIPHAGLNHYFNHVLATYNIPSKVVLPFMAAPGFDISLLQMFMPLLTGGTCLIIDQDDVQHVDRIVAALQQASVIDSVPGVYNLLLNYIFENNLQTRFAHVERIVVGGDSVPDYLLRSLASVFTNAVITMAYGPTEATIFCTHRQYAPGTITAATSGTTIGRPFNKAQIYILDAWQQLLPLGVKGEIYIGGEGVAKGYLNNPTLTREKFIVNPYGPGYLYRTGDVGRWLPDGDIMFCGRNDRQVKIRGNRIEPGELENRLKQLHGIKDCIVQLHTPEDGDAQLIAFYTGEKMERSMLADFLRGFFVESVIPAAYIWIAEIPLTANGKIDRKTLLALLAEAAAAVDSVYTPPGNETEQLIADIWSALLKKQQISIYDNFFELGGHSLLAMRVISAIRKKTGQELTIRHLFNYPTIAGLATQLNSITIAPAVNVLSRSEQTGLIPLSFAQERLWFIDRLQGSTQYHMPWLFRIKGALDTAILESAFREIIERHEVLRTVISDHEGVGYQQLRSPADWRLQHIAAETLAEKGLTPASFIDSLLLQPYNLAADYMLRVTVITEAPGIYTLLLMVHHIAFDGWSVNILVNELVTLYSNYQAGAAARLPQLAVRYADYAIWQRQYLTGQLLENKLAYWKDRLNDLEPLSLPVDFPRPVTQSIQGAQVNHKINNRWKDALIAFARKEDVTPFMATLALFKVLLYRYSGRERICVGTPVAGRDHQELENMIGFFVNTLALDSTLTHRLTFRELLQQVKQTTLDAYEHQDVPFEKVVDVLGVERDMSRNPVFQVMFTAGNVPGDAALDIADVQIFPQQPGTITSLFEMTLDVAVQPDGLQLSMVYCSDLFREETVSNMLLHYERLLAAALTDADKPIGRLEMLSPEETHKLIHTFNDTLTAYPSYDNIAALFTAQAARTPDAVAVVFEDTQLTYRQLDERTNQLGHYLRQQGVTAETMVPLCLDRSLEMIIGILGILKAGGAYVPIDPGYPMERINYILQDTSARHLLTNRASSHLFNLHQKLLLVLLDDDWQYIGVHPATEVNAATQPHDAAYVIYTSGSTGQPKGVINEQAGVINRLQWTQDYFKLGLEDVVLQKTTYCFDVSVWELLWPLISGARLLFARPGGHKDTAYLSRLIENAGVTTIHFVPSMLTAFLESLPAANTLRLKRVLCSGEALLPHHVKQFREKMGATGLYNLYGPTEAAIDVTCWDVPESFAGDVVPIGKPVANTQLYILDAGRELTPEGASGELYIGGIQVARGYLNKPELSADKFLPDTFSGIPGGRLYRTGDTVRRLPDGNIEYLGRADDQVKIRGYRIELGEVEYIIQDSGLVIHCAVLARADASGTKQLVGYIVPNDKFDREGFLFYMRRRLPDYMIPSLLVSMDALPLTASGKVNRKALPAPDAGQLLTKEYVAPRTETERQMAIIWQELLNVERVGVNDNFFELGGHSIIMIQVVNRMKHAGYPVELKDIFKYQTIAGIAAGVIGQLPEEIILPDHLITLYNNGGKRPCFILPGMDGVSSNFADLANELGIDGYHVYGVQMQGIFDDEEPMHNMSDIAAFTLSLIRKVQPYGPYRLIGYSFGGQVLYEVIRTLEAEGAPIEMAWMLDIGAELGGIPEKEKAIEYAVSIVSNILERYELADRYAGWQSQLREFLLSVPVDAIGGTVARFLKERAAYVKDNIDLQLLKIRLQNAFITHQPAGTINTGVILVKATDEQGREQEGDMGWSLHINRLKIINAPGDHFSMVKNENVRVLYQLVKDARVSLEI